MHVQTLKRPIKLQQYPELPTATVMKPYVSSPIFLDQAPVSCSREEISLAFHIAPHRISLLEW